jgi:hypothetical protein
MRALLLLVALTSITPLSMPYDHCPPGSFDNGAACVPEQPNNTLCTADTQCCSHTCDIDANFPEIGKCIDHPHGFYDCH